MTTTVLALDLSLTSTGVADIDGTPTRLRTALKGVERLAWCRREVMELVLHQAPDVVAIEGYAFGRPNQASHIGELGGVIRLALHDACVPFVEIPPASVKKYATGKGNARKEEMLGAAIRRLDYQGNSNDEADALWLRAMTLDALDAPAVVVPIHHRAALDAVTWPDLEATPA